MANQKIVLAQLDIDVKALLAAALQSKDALAKVKQELQALQQAGDTTSSQFLKMQADFKQLTDVLNTQVKALKDQARATEKLAERQEDAAKSAKKAAKAQEKLTEAYEETLDAAEEVANQIESLSDAAQDAAGVMQELNSSIEQNNTLLEEGSAANGAKTFTDYKQKTIEAAQSINVFNGGLGDFLSRAQEAGGTGNLFKQALGGMTSGIMGMGAAIKANPIGFLLSLIAPLIEQFKKFTPLTTAVEKAMAALGPVINVVSMPIKLLAEGVTYLINGFTSLMGSMSSAADEAIKLKEAEAQLNTQMALQEERNDKAKRQMDELIKKSNDQTLSEQQRLEALQEAAAVENANYAERKKLADEAYRIALEKVKQEKELSNQEINIIKNGTAAQVAKLQETKGITADELKTLQSAKVEKQRIAHEEGAILERQAADRKALADRIKAEEDARNREAEANRKARLDKALEHQKQLLDLFVAENNARGKSLAEQLKFEEDYAAKSVALLQKQLNLKKITQQQFDKEKIILEDQLGKNKIEITGRFAKAEFDLWMQQHQSKIEAGKTLTKLIADEENERLEQVMQAQIKLLEQQTGFDSASITLKQQTGEALFLEETTFLTELLRIQNDFAAQKKANDDALKTADTERANEEKAQKATELQADYQIKLNNAQTEFEAQEIMAVEQQRVEKERLDQQLADKQITKEQYDQLLLDSEEDLKEELNAIEQAKQANKLQLASQTFGNMATILGKESAAGKAMAVAQATIDTYQAATAAYKAMTGIPVVGPALGGIAAAAAVAAGIQNVKKITATKPPKAEKGALFGIGGRRHSQGGTLFTGADGTQFEAEQGELIGVMNRNAARHFMAFNNAFPAGGGAAPNYFANGGIVSREMAQQPLNIDELAAKIATANAALPQPVVAVEDIITQSNSYVRVRDGANF